MRYTLGVCWLAVTCLAMANSQPFSSIDSHVHWNNFKVNHGKRYSSIEEEQTRQQIFVKNLRLIHEHNKLYEEGKTTYTLKMNKFGDLTHEEYNRMLNGGRTGIPDDLLTSVYSRPSQRNQDLPPSVDWREKGAVTPVRDQGHCGSCWAFATIASLEGAHFLKTGKLVALSEQNLMDCAWGYGDNKGCGGGEAKDAFRYIQENGGIDTLDSYPYEAKNAECRFKKETVGATVSNYTLVTPRSEADLQSAVANVGPVSVGIYSGFTLMFYDGGLYYGADCDSEHLGHAVTVVGYGTCSEGDYWIVKNSHGQDWGEKGYVRMSRNRDNNCGIATRPVYPNV